MRYKIFTILLSFIFLSLHASSQDTTQSEPVGIDYEILSANVDSLIQDSLAKAFILNHKPLTKNEASQYNMPISQSIYGQHVAWYIKNSDVFKVKMMPKRMRILERELSHREWIFYIFVALIFMTVLINSLYPVYLNKLMKIFLNPTLVFNQSREISFQDPLPSFFYQFLFFLSCSLYLFFSYANVLNIAEIGWSKLILGCTLLLILVYAAKYLSLRFFGWVFKQEDTFENYAFLVTMINKLAGVMLLFLALLLAYASKESHVIYFRVGIFLLTGLFILRLLRGYQIFSKQARIGILSYILSFVSLELLPTCILAKFILDELVTRKIDFL